MSPKEQSKTINLCPESLDHNEFHERSFQYCRVYNTKGYQFAHLTIPAMTVTGPTSRLGRWSDRATMEML